MSCPCRSPAKPCRQGFRMCLSHLIYTLWPSLIHTCHAAPMPCCAHAVLLKAVAQHGRRETACGLPACVRFLLTITWSSVKVVTRRKPISDAGAQCETKHHLSWMRKRVVAAHYKKDDLLHCWISSSHISGYHVDFHEGHSTVGAGQGHCVACVN